MTRAPGNEFDPPMFSECVIGYRAWISDADGQLWPIGDKRRPWRPGVNEARCNLDNLDNLDNPQSLRLQWSNHNGRVSLEQLPAHDAPIADCDCGLYSWRRPPGTWYDDPSRFELPWVIGAIASWGALHVHDAGFRAQYACIVAVAHPAGTTSDVMSELQAIAGRYRVELASLSELEHVAGLHGAPLRDDVRPPAPTADPITDRPPQPPQPAPDATSAELRTPRRVGFDGRPLPHAGFGFSGSGTAGA